MVDFKAIEEKWQKEWNDKKVFEANVDKNRQKIFFTTPYPYISGSLHLGHGRTIVESDIYCRYKRMKGFNVLFPISFHITGTPVLGISSAIKNGDKEKIKLYQGYVSAYVNDAEKVDKIVKSFEEPQKIVDFFIPRMIGEYKQLGVGIDWRRSFTSGDMEHQQMVTWQFEEYNNKGYLVKGSHPVLYSPQDESAMGEDDIQEADSNPVEKQEFTILKFKFKDKYLVAATLRPETVFGQTNLWVNPEIEYYEAKVGNETWILSKEAIFKLNHQKKTIKEIGKSKEKIIGEYVVAPMINKKIIVLPSRFVDSDVGTGIVTSVPSDAPYDYVALKELQENEKEIRKYGLDVDEIRNIKIIPIIKTEKFGKEAAVKLVDELKIKKQDDEKLENLTQEVYKEGFHNGVLLENCGKYAGMKITEAKERMKQDMLKNSNAETMYETSRKAVSRSGGKIIVAILDDQWFIDFNAKGWKEEAQKCLKQITLIPEGNRKQFEDVFAWLDKRPCARKRGLGTVLPFNKNWIIESLSDSTIYMTLYTINNIIRENKLTRENLTHDFFNFVYLGKGELKEVSKKTKVSTTVLSKLRESFEYWMPNDQRHTFILHLSNHLSFMIFAFAGLFPEKDWPKKISFHGLVISDGEKMSKSRGNVISLPYVKETYGADVFRFYLTQSANITGVFDWKESEAQSAKQTIEKIYLQILESATEAKKGKVRDLFVSKFNRILKEASSKIEELKIREHDNIIVYDMLSLIRSAKSTMDKNELAAFYDFIIRDWLKLLAPICPHIAEEIWHKLGEKTFISLESWPKADESKIKQELEKAEEFIQSIISDVNNVLKLAKIEKPSQVSLFVAEKWKYTLYETLKVQLEKTRDVKELMKAVMSTELKRYGQEVQKTIFKVAQHGLPEFLKRENELKTLEESKKEIEKQFNCKVEVILEENSKEQKAKQSMPGKVAIVVK